MEIRKEERIIERILNKGVEQILPSKEVLKKKLLSGERLTIYQGFDPTAKSLHIGHTVGMRKLEDFRKLGHKVVFLIGDFTARIGDPDKSQTRKMLTKEEVEENMKVYIDQASHIIDIYNKENPVEVKYNSQWHDKLTFADVIKLSSELTVQQILKRSLFQERIKNDNPIHLNEFLYPLSQAYDSVVMEVDVEIGGNDQLFNMLVGREMVLNHLKKEKIVIAGKLLVSSDGQKMGKSIGNVISLDDSPQDIYGKVMAFDDDKILIGFEILTNSTLEEVNEYEKRLKSGENPMDLKKELAFKITSEITTKEDATKAQSFFESVFQKKEANVEIPEISININEIALTDLLVKVGFTSSKGQARRLIEQGAVKINNKKMMSYNERINITTNPPVILKAGRHITKITLQK